MNNINKLQNLNQQLNYLAAQRQLYSDAKRIYLIKGIVSIPFIIIISIIAAIYPQSQAYVAILSMTIVFFDLLIFEPIQKQLQERAAKVQELFDTKVLQIRWNDFKVGSIPDAEEIFESNFKYLAKNTDYSDLKSWYPAKLNKIPLYLARVICQRTNCWWDSKLRKKYILWIVISTAILTVVICLLGLIGGMNLVKFILVIASPLMPLYVFSIDEYQKNMESISLIDNIKVNCEILWRQILSKEVRIKDVNNTSRNLQDEIFEGRKKNPMIFDWIYKLLRGGFERQMAIGANVLINEAKAALKV